MLADQGVYQTQTGALDHGVHLPGEWFNSLIEFVSKVLPAWRDDPERPVQTSENGLTAQLCSRLTSASRHSSGWDFLQFKREEPDDADSRRSIDIVVAPSGTKIWIEGRKYTEYQTLLPIECKRLPTPSGYDRDEREYLYSRFSTTGGIQRFKAGHHASLHTRAAMIGYVQDRTISIWANQLDRWVEDLEGESIDGWSVADKLILRELDASLRTAALQSVHNRPPALNNLMIDHLWIEM